MEQQANVRALGELAHRVLTCGDVEMDIDAHTVRVDGHIVSFTFFEFELLHRLLRQPGWAFRRSDLMVSPGGAEANERSVDIHISRIRKKVATARTFRLETVPRVGYRCRNIAQAPTVMSGEDDLSWRILIDP